MSPKLKPWLVLAVIFIAGGLSGAALTIALSPRFMHAHMRPRDPAHMRQDIMAGLTRDLSLTPDQQAKIQPIVEQTAGQLQAVHLDEMGKVSQIFKSTDDQMAAILTPGQNTELQKLEAEREKAFSGHMHFHGPPEDDLPPPPPPGPAPAPPGPPPGQPAPPPPGH